MRRRTMIGLAVFLTAGLVAGSVVLAVGGHRGHSWHEGAMKRFASSMLDEALDEAAVTDEQRQRIHAARDRVFGAVEAHRSARRDHLEKALALFEADQVDEQQVAALHQEAEAGRREVAQVVHEALVEVHDTLSPAQRKVLADYVRDFRGWRH